MSEKVKPGYKQTEVGVIPEDWEVKPLVSLSTEIGDGIHSTPNYVKSSEFYFVNGNNLVNGRISITDSTMCVSESECKSFRKNLSDRTLLLSINGTIGNLAFYNGEQVILGKSAAYINVAKTVSKTFISYCLKSRPAFLFFENELTGTTIRNLSLQSLRNTPVPLPPTIEEQRAIAGALSDVDALIGALDSALTKKRDLKQAAMQQLLTGQKRLPGFHGEWETKTLFELAERKKELFDDGDWIEAEYLTESGIRLVQTGNIGEGCFTDKESKKYISSESFKKLRCKELQIGDILICRLAEPAGRACILPDIGEERIITAVDVTIFRPLTSVADRHYLVNVFNTRQWLGAVNERCGGSTRTRIARGELGKMVIKIPPVPEQTAIAEVLSDMDAELAALEQRRDKTRALKQGMMQELLTGRTRLI